MPETNISNAAVGANSILDYTPDLAQTDGAGDQKETTYQITNWDYWFGMYKTIPELKISIDAKSTWTVGKGFKSNELTTLALSAIKGFGKETFNSILANMIRTYHIAGDSYAEIIRNKEGRLVNLKTLDPSTMRIVANRKGIILRYEQTAKIGIKGVTVQTFQPEEIFHLSRNRIADEIHGVSLVQAVEWIILARNEAMQDFKKLLHRNVFPVRIWHLDTDVPAKIEAFKTKVASAKGEAEDIFIPKGAVETEVAAVAPNATLNPLPWITQLNHYFFQATSVPQVIVGGSQGMTEAAVKIEYLAFEQTVEGEQLYIEEQVLSQLNLEINLEFPASLQNEMLSDQGKEETMQASTPEDTQMTQNAGQVTGVAK